MEELSFLRQAPGPGFTCTTVRIEPGRSRLYDAAEWRDALVVVEAGEVQLECRHGARRPFARGSVLCLDGLKLRALHNLGDEKVLLVAVARLR